ncbi:ATPase, T2SS/T4P/T4SS family [Janibacter terrae]|uniref:ATPase, T2SS/T4P/T4SS family n=1 Tax=Janibacter terrae TaxID=103817 RepID=A0ABZ2FL46_9MICO|nr:ATPase, T2SS/T4P/T4SS family [Janibacter terrae]
MTTPPGGRPDDPTALPLFAAQPDPDERTHPRDEVAQRLAAGAGSVSPYDRHAAPEHTPPPPTWGMAPASATASMPSMPATATLPTVPAQRLSADVAHASEVDWSQVAELRTQASEMLTGALQDRQHIEPAAQRELGRSIIVELLQTTAANNLAVGRRAWSIDEQDRIGQAVFDALFGLGRLQPLVDDERVENIEITGCDNVLLEYTDGTLRPGPPVAENDQELIDFLVFLASRSEVNARPFSEAQPRLHMRLDGGARLAATAWVTPRPSLVIRRHRLREITLEELSARGMLDSVAVSFLRAAVKAKKSIVVAGAQGAGKTTMVRALCAELDPWERIGTFETEYELHLHELPDKHRRIVAWESRPGSGEVGPDGRQAGEIPLDDLLYDSFRFNLSRQIVGEVRGREVLAMIKAMQSGSGSISTTHSANAIGAIRKLVTCAMEAGSHVTEAYAQRAIAEHIDVIVQVQLDTTPTEDGQARRERYISEIIVIHPGEDGPATTHVFQPSPHGGPPTPGILPDDYRALARWGFDIEGYFARAGAP